MKTRVKVNGIEVEFETETDLPAFGSPFAPSGKSQISVLGTSLRESEDYDKRMGIRARHHLTVAEPIDATWIVDRVKDRIAGKTVIELGAGVGYLAVELAAYCKHVFAIEADVKWSWTFAEKLYATKPRNLTWIFDRAENLVDILKADVAIVVTGSDDVWLRELARKFAPDVCMPWQDWNGGAAVISSASWKVDEEALDEALR